MSSQSWTVRRLLEWTAEYLKARGGSRLEAEVLLAHALGCNRVGLYLKFEEIPGDDQRGAFRELVKRRAAGEPVAYLVGHKEFYSLDFEVTPATLIPRPETEHIVLEGIEFLRNRPSDQPVRILDIGTGSGALAVAFAKNLPNAEVTAVDISAPALAVAKRNAAKHQVADRIEFLKSDLFSAVEPEKKFTLIVSNPPYVSRSEYDALDPSVKDYEPKSALLSGETGTEVAERILRAAPGYLEEGGLILIEISPMIADAMTAFLKTTPFSRYSVINDFAGLKRVISAEIR